MLVFRPGVEMSLEEMGKMPLSPAEALLEGLKHIMRFPRDGGERSPEERDRMEKEFRRRKPHFGSAVREAASTHVRVAAMRMPAVKRNCRTREPIRTLRRSRTCCLTATRC